MEKVLAGIAMAIGSAATLKVTADNCIRKEREIWSTVTDERIANELNDAESDILAKACELEKQVDSLNAMEKKSIDSLIADLEQKYGYSERISLLQKDKQANLSNLKKELRIEELVKEANDKANAELSAFDEANHISSGIEECKKTIADAKSKYEHSKTMVEFFNDDTESVEAMKKAAKKLRNSVVSEQEAKIKELSSKFDSEKTRVNSELAKQTAEIRKTYEDAKKSCAAKFDDDISVLSNERRDAVNEIYKNVISARTDDEKCIRETANEMSEMADDIKNKVADKLKEEAANMDKTELLVEYLKNHNWTKPKVVVAASLPGIPLVYACVRYVKIVANVVSKM